MKIIDYQILTSYTAQKLADKVMRYIDEGFQPIGGLVYGGADEYLQVVVKYSEDQKLKSDMSEN